jgi:hypothetical protein
MWLKKRRGHRYARPGAVSRRLGAGEPTHDAIQEYYNTHCSFRLGRSKGLLLRERLEGRTDKHQSKCTPRTACRELVYGRNRLACGAFVIKRSSARDIV